jgi:hypothetical protein
VDAEQVRALRALLEPGEWMEHARWFARALRGQARRTSGGLLVVGTPDDEPWHLTAHLADEARLAGLPTLDPTLVRWRPPPGAPPHLSVGLARLERARRGERLFVVSEQAAPAPLLERVGDARRAGATVLALDRGDPDLDGLAHEALDASAVPVSFDAAQHLVSAVAGEARQSPDWLRSRLARLLNAISGPG